MMEKWLNAYKKEALVIFETNGKLDAVKFLMGKRNQAQRLIFGLKNCKEMLEAWIDDKDYIPDAIKLAQYDKLKEERDSLSEQLEKSKSILQSVYFMFDNYEEGTMGKRLSNEAKELLNNLKK